MSSTTEQEQALGWAEHESGALFVTEVPAVLHTGLLVEELRNALGPVPSRTHTERARLYVLVKAKLTATEQAAVEAVCKGHDGTERLAADEKAAAAEAERQEAARARRKALVERRKRGELLSLAEMQELLDFLLGV